MEYSIVKRNISIYNFNRDLELWSSSSRLPAAHTCFNQLDLPAHEVCSFSLVQIGNNVLSFSDLQFRNALKGLELLNPVPSRTSPTKLHSEKLTGFCPDQFCDLRLGQASPAPTQPAFYHRSRLLKKQHRQFRICHVPVSYLHEKFAATAAQDSQEKLSVVYYGSVYVRT